MSVRNYGTATPTEIIQQIFSYLAPTDLNAVRHTCSNWMKASLDADLLSTALKRGGWSTDPKTSARTRHIGSLAWVFSCRLARECALSGGWTGNGLRSTLNSTQSFAPTALVQTSHVDFSDLASGMVSTSACGGLIMTTSVCGRFLLVANGLMIYVYELIRDKILFWTTIACPHRVLTTTMDTVALGYDVAVLLDGREGLVCHLQGSSRPSARTSAVTSYGVYPGPETKRFRHFQNLCSKDDPPRSVSICPQRQCIAFGCGAGLELHWVDALTGQDLNR